MNDYTAFRDAIKDYFAKRGIEFEIESTLKESSKNDQASSYLYTGSMSDFQVISMDALAQMGYHKIRVVKDVSEVQNAEREINVNTVDAFMIDINREWFFIEFKDCKISSKKDNIEKKGMANWLMLMDIFFEMGVESCKGILDLLNPFEFSRKHITYIVVCSKEKDPYTWEQVRNFEKVNEHYTPKCLYKFKYFFFKDAYAYTTEFFEERLIKKHSFQSLCD